MTIRYWNRIPYSETAKPLAGPPVSVDPEPDVLPRISRLLARRVQLSSARAAGIGPRRPECWDCKTRNACGFVWGNLRSQRYKAPCGLYVRPRPGLRTPDLPGLDLDPRLPSALEIEESYA